MGNVNGYEVYEMHVLYIFIDNFVVYDIIYEKRLLESQNISQKWPRLGHLFNGIYDDCLKYRKLDSNRPSGSINFKVMIVLNTENWKYTLDINQKCTVNS